jgi:hypothetical protein
MFEGDLIGFDKLGAHHEAHCTGKSSPRPHRSGQSGERFPRPEENRFLFRFGKDAFGLDQERSVVSNARQARSR